VLVTQDLVTTRRRACCLQRSPLCFTRECIVCVAYMQTCRHYVLQPASGMHTFVVIPGCSYVHTHDHTFVLVPLVLIHAQMNTWQEQPVFRSLHTCTHDKHMHLFSFLVLHTCTHKCTTRTYVCFHSLGFDMCTHEYTAGAASFAYMCDTQIPCFHSWFFMHAHMHP